MSELIKRPNMSFNTTFLDKSGYTLSWLNLTIPISEEEETHVMKLHNGDQYLTRIGDVFAEMLFLFWVFLSQINSMKYF